MAGTVGRPSYLLALEAHADLLALIAAALGPELLLVLGSSCRSLNAFIASPQLTRVWEAFGSAAGLASSSSAASLDPMSRYLRLAKQDLTGTWLDAGEDNLARERYRFLTAMWQTRRCGLKRTLEAVTQLDDTELKLSVTTLAGTQYRCVECFVQDALPQQILDVGVAATLLSRRPIGFVDNVVNVATGSLDESNIEAPSIAGTWEQFTFPTYRKARDWFLANMDAVVVSKEARARGGDQRAVGRFKFTKISSTLDPSCAQNMELRERGDLKDCKALFFLEQF